MDQAEQSGKSLEVAASPVSGGQINVADAPLAAVRLSAQGDIVEQSVSGGNLAALWQASEDGLLSLAADARQSGLPQDARVGGEGSPGFWVMALKDSDSVVLMARDTTLNDRVTSALMQSRTMLKGLLDAAVDVAFQVDAEGRFTFATPKTAFGEKTEDWLGMSAQRIFWADGDVPGRNPFGAREGKTVKGLRANFRDGARRYLDITVEPDLDDQGRRIGVRGIAREVTDGVAKSREMRLVNLRLMVHSRITAILNSSDSSEELLDRAAKVILEVLRADAVWILTDYGDGLVPAAVEGEGAQGLDTGALWQAVKSLKSIQVVPHMQAGTELLAVRLLGEEHTGGVLVVSRDTHASPWSEEERKLLAAVGDTLAAALSKAALFDRLYYLSCRDELTEILNRRALGETIVRRLKHQSRTGLSGALLFIDLDHFKEVNDTLGHKAGDDALKTIASWIRTNIRPCDYVGRYGGDEFIVWLEDASEAIAAQKGRAIIDAMDDVRKTIGAGHLRLGASVGVACSAPGIDRSFEELADRADAALYEVKKTEKGQVAIAALPVAE